MTTFGTQQPISQIQLDEVLRLHGEWLRTGQGQPANLSHRNLSGCNLQLQNLSGADLNHADLSKVPLTEAVLRNCDLSYAKLIHADLEKADLSQSDCGHADFTSANLEQARLRRCTLTNVQFANANLAWANLRRADLRWAHLESATLTRADLSKATLRTEHNRTRRRRFRDRALRLLGFQHFAFVLDENTCIGTKFPQKSADPWSHLRRTYTGTRFVVLLLATALAFAPLIAVAVMWRGLSILEHSKVFNRLLVAQDESPDHSQSSNKTDVQDPVEPDKAAPRDSDGKQLDRGWKFPKLLKQYSVGLLLIGWYRGWSQCALNILLLLYNGLRGYLTYSISPLRDEEDRTGTCPSKQDTMWWWRLHRLTAWLGPVSSIILLIRVAETAFATVLLPK